MGRSRKLNFLVGESIFRGVQSLVPFGKRSKVVNEAGPSRNVDICADTMMSKNPIGSLLMKLFEWIKLLPCLFSPFNSEVDKLVIVTGADSSHYKSLRQFLSSLFVHEPDIEVIVFDLGLIESERQCLKDTFPRAELRLFDYSQYPDYFNIKVNAGEYAWKPVILYDALSEFKCCVCWMDAGNLVTKRLFWLRRITKAVGMYSPRSSGLISDWTHPRTVEFLGAFDVLHKPNLNGACVAVCYQNSKVRDLVSQWKEYALIRECIAPVGSCRKNHRQDQAVLSVIGHQSGITKNMPRGHYGFRVHQDID